ncbi:hypothetical protein V5799_003905 [Amblyomma americanum]|uniref:Secreted protein n=1 Tax=Amblyomma americanum TaxID=6943 RepID=A0AAQ4D7M3_AMBAM
MPIVSPVSLLSFSQLCATCGVADLMASEVSTPDQRVEPSDSPVSSCALTARARRLFFTGWVTKQTSLVKL